MALSLGFSDSLALVISASSFYNPFYKILTSYSSDFPGGFPGGSVGKESALNAGRLMVLKKVRGDRLQGVAVLDSEN